MLVSIPESSDPRLLSFMQFLFIKTSYIGDKYQSEKNTLRGHLVLAGMTE